MGNPFALDAAALVSVLNHLNIGVYVTDGHRRILFWNRKAEEITGYRAADVVGKSCAANILVHVDKDNHPLCTTNLCPLYRSISLGLESEEPMLVFAKHADGRRVGVSVSTAPLRDAAGKIIGGVEVFGDVTAQIHDMEFANRIQRRLLPAVLPEIPNVRFDVRYFPHDLVGGDFYDVRPLGANRFGFMVADVRGHGVSAALYTMWLKSLGESLAAHASLPAKFMTEMGRELKKFVVEDSFATAFYGVLDARRFEVTYTNAGHNPPLHFQAAGGEIASLDLAGLPLGIVADVKYSSATMRLAPGDLLLCYTDGLTDPANKQGHRLGKQGLAALLKEHMRRKDKNLLERIYRRVKHQCGQVTLADDVLLLSIERIA